MQTSAPSPIKERECVVTRAIWLTADTRAEIGDTVTLPNERANELRAAGRVRFATDAAPTPPEPAEDATPTAPKGRRR